MAETPREVQIEIFLGFGGRLQIGYWTDDNLLGCDVDRISLRNAVEDLPDLYAEGVGCKKGCIWLASVLPLITFGLVIVAMVVTVATSFVAMERKKAASDNGGMAIEESDWVLNFSIIAGGIVVMFLVTAITFWVRATGAMDGLMALENRVEQLNNELAPLTFCLVSTMAEPLRVSQDEPRRRMRYRYVLVVSAPPPAGQRVAATPSDPAASEVRLDIGAAQSGSHLVQDIALKDVIVPVRSGESSRTTGTGTPMTPSSQRQRAASEPPQASRGQAGQAPQTGSPSAGAAAGGQGPCSAAPNRLRMQQSTLLGYSSASTSQAFSVGNWRSDGSGRKPDQRPLFCANCGSRCAPTANFCSQCGSKLQ